jgi:predicted Rossmann fold nucleotide-binding protein DprA/Smf involved in DNA uptake
MKFAVVGDRKFTDYKLMREELAKIDGITEIVSGGAPGADTLAEEWSKEYLGKDAKVFPAEWNKWGKRAGPIRNRLIWEYADQGIAFLAPWSKGTKNSIEWAEFFGKKIKVVKIYE